MFTVEDSRNYAKRLNNAFIQRLRTYKQLEYNYYISNMPVLGLPELNNKSLNKILKYLKSKHIKDPENDENVMNILS